MSECIKDLLGEYLDSELSPPEAKRVEDHCASCPSCRGELDDLQHVSKAVSGLGKQGLPVGFMQRLERRRKQTAAAPASREGWLPRPARWAAFAFSAAVAMIVIRDRLPSVFPTVGGLGGVTIRSDAETASSARRQDAAPAAPAAASKTEGAPARKLSRARGEPLLELSPAQAKEREALAAKAAAEAAFNEEQRQRLEAEKKAMGIKQIVLPQDDVRHPMGQMAGMGMSGGGMNLQTLALSNAPATVGGATPGMLAPAAATRGSVVRARAATGASGIVLGSDKERAALWAQRGLTAKPPTVDYAKKRLVVVVSNDFSSAVEIVDVRELPDRFVVLYRLDDLDEEAARQAAAPSYQYRLLPASDLPVTFERVP